MDISKIENPQFLKKLKTEELNALAQDIRSFLIENVSKTGGHLSSNLGVVELTIALHTVFNSPEDKIFFDVGHQCYIHKILTGRADRFNTLRQWNGISGFQKRAESEHDVWEAGHSSTSLSAALGMAVARDMDQENYAVIPVIGDGALSGGMALEALNQIGSEQRNMIIVFNDNNMSISQNVGALNLAFARLRTSKPYNEFKHDLKGALKKNVVGQTLLSGMQTVKDTIKKTVVDSSIFGEFGIEYLGPVNGHDIKAMMRVFNTAKKHEGPVVIHVLTTKGKGYPYCEDDREGKWHGVSQFDPETGIVLGGLPPGHLSWSSVMSETLIRLAKQDENIIAVTPAMITGSKLEKFFGIFPNRAFDCGIAEEHATTFVAGLACAGKKPFISLYSSFLQRAYDQINHDIARMQQPVVIGIDRAGLVGEDGDTHHGLFDIALLRSLPHMVLSQPKDGNEAQNLLYSAFKASCPYAIRYPRGSVVYDEVSEFEVIETGTWTKLNDLPSNKLIVITYGPDVDKVTSKVVLNQLPVTIINARFFKPLDLKMLEEIANWKLDVIVYESDMLAGGLSSAILEVNNDHHLNMQIERIGISDQFIPHGSMHQLRKYAEIDINTLFEVIKSKL